MAQAAGTEAGAAGKAALLVTGAMAIIGFIDNFVPRIAAEAGLWQFHATRAAMALPVLALACRIAGWRLRPRNWRRVALRSTFNAASMLVYFACLAVLPIGTVVAGLFTAPIFVLLISALVLKERIGPRRIAAVAAGFAGILLIVRPGGAAMEPLALLPVVGGVFYAVSAIGTRVWCAEESAPTLLAGFFLFVGTAGALVAPVLTLWGQGEGFVLRPWVPLPGPEFWIWTAAQAGGSLVSVAMIIRAYQIAPASRVAVYEYALLPFAALWALLLWGQGVDALALAGMTLIVAAGVGLALLPAPRTLAAP